MNYAKLTMLNIALLYFISIPIKLGIGIGIIKAIAILTLIVNFYIVLSLLPLILSFPLFDSMCFFIPMAGAIGWLQEIHRLT